MRVLRLLPFVVTPLVAQQAPATWHLSPEPALRLGGAEGTGPTEFANPYDAVFWGHRLVILDGGSQSLRLFSPRDGRYLDTYGRKGAGPGEYTNAVYLQALPGDSLFISDLRQSRYTILDSAGKVARVVSFATVRPGARSTPLGRLKDGSVLAWSVRFDAAMRDDLHQIHALILRVSPDGTRADSLRVLPFTTGQAYSIGGRPGWRVAFGAGQLQPAVGSDFAFFNSPTEYLLYVLDSNLRWSLIQQAVAPRLSRPRDVNDLRQQAVGQGASPALMSQVKMVDTLPAIANPKVSPSGLLFAVDGAVDSTREQRGVTVFSRGAAVARFHFPSGLQLLGVSDHQVVFTEREPEHGPSILVYDLLR